MHVKEIHNMDPLSFNTKRVPGFILNLSLKDLF
jgi:hypothetical protein